MSWTGDAEARRCRRSFAIAIPTKLQERLTSTRQGLGWRLLAAVEPNREASTPDRPSWGALCLSLASLDGRGSVVDALLADDAVAVAVEILGPEANLPSSRTCGRGSLGHRGSRCSGLRASGFVSGRKAFGTMAGRFLLEPSVSIAALAAAAAAVLASARRSWSVVQIRIALLFRERMPPDACESAQRDCLDRGSSEEILPDGVCSASRRWWRRRGPLRRESRAFWVSCIADCRTQANSRSRRVGVKPGKEAGSPNGVAPEASRGVKELRPGWNPCEEVVSIAAASGAVLGPSWDLAACAAEAEVAMGRRSCTLRLQRTRRVHHVLQTWNSAEEVI